MYINSKWYAFFFFFSFWNWIFLSQPSKVWKGYKAEPTATNYFDNPKTFHCLADPIDITEAVTRGRSAKKVFLKMSPNSQGNTCVRVSFLIKLQALGLQLYLKRDSSTSVSLQILRSFSEHLFLKNTSCGCFWY